MNPLVSIIPADRESLLDLAHEMRLADRKEIMRSSGLDPQPALERAKRMSDWIMAAYVGRDLVCHFGVAPIDRAQGIGSPWMLGTGNIEKHSRILLRHSKGVVEKMLGDYPVLTNFVDCENTVAIRWLEWLGFRLLGTHVMGVANHPFIQFEKKRYV